MIMTAVYGIFQEGSENSAPLDLAGLSAHGSSESKDRYFALLSSAGVVWSQMRWVAEEFAFRRRVLTEAPVQGRAGYAQVLGDVLGHKPV